MFTKREKDGIIYYTSPLFDSYGIKHMFCTRYGGVSSGDFFGLNVSTARKDFSGCTDNPENVAANYRKALAVLGVDPENACAARQTHSNTVIELASSDGGKGTGIKPSFEDGCDGIILRKNTDNIKAATVKTADCVPVLLADISTGDVCAVHAGWRGSAADIVTKAASALSGGKCENIIAAIGPCIGRCCYEIGDEVYNAFKMLFYSKTVSFDCDALFTVMPSCSMGGSRHLDLAMANKELLVLCGVKRENIDASGICTCCFKDENGSAPFFSHRGSGGHSGTFLSAIAL